MRLDRIANILMVLGVCLFAAAGVDAADLGSNDLEIAAVLFIGLGLVVTGVLLRTG